MRRESAWRTLAVTVRTVVVMKMVCLLSELWLCVLNDRKIYMNYIVLNDRKIYMNYIKHYIIWLLFVGWYNNVTFTEYPICTIPLIIAKLYLYTIRATHIKTNCLHISNPKWSCSIHSICQTPHVVLLVEPAPQQDHTQHSLCRGRQKKKKNIAMNKMAHKIDVHNRSLLASI